MDKNREFVDSLRQEINALGEYYDKFDEAGRGKKQFAEYRELFETFLMKLEAADYDIVDCKACMQALGTICDLRLQGFIEKINVDEPEFEEDAPWQYMFEVNIGFLNNSIERVPAFSIKHSILLMALKAVRPKWGACETIKNLSESQKAEMGTKLNTFYRSVDDDLRCSKRGAELLENLMGEFSEFDAFLERTA